MKLESISYPEQYVCKLTVSASADEFEAAIEADYQSKRATLKIKGFEEGAATRADAETVRGEDFFWFDAANTLLDNEAPAIYDAVVAEHQLEVVSECIYDVERVTKADGFIVSITFCLLPQFTFGDPKEITVTQQSLKVTDAEVEQIFAAQKNVKPELADTFRAQIREKLAQHRAETALPAAKNKVLTEFASMAKGELPTPMVDEAYENLMNQLNDLLQRNQSTMEQFLATTGHTKEELRENTRMGAQLQVRTALSLVRYGRTLGYTPTPEQVEKEILLRAEQVKSRVKDFAQRASRRRVAQSIERKQAVDYIMSCATIVNPDEV